MVDSVGHLNRRHNGFIWPVKPTTVMTQEVMILEVQLSNVYKQSCQQTWVQLLCILAICGVLMALFPWNVNPRSATCWDLAILLRIVNQRELNDAKCERLTFSYDFSKENNTFVDEIIRRCNKLSVIDALYISGLFLQFRVSDQKTRYSQGWYCEQRWYETQYHVHIYHVLCNIIQA